MIATTRAAPWAKAPPAVEAPPPAPPMPRLLTIEEAALALRYGRSTVRGWVSLGELPVVILPSMSANDRPGRRNPRVPAAWISRWFAMRDRSRPIWTSRPEIERSSAPPYMTVREAAEGIGASEPGVRCLHRLGRFAKATPNPGGTILFAAADFDAWLLGLIHEAEAAWYGVDVPGKVART